MIFKKQKALIAMLLAAVMLAGTLVSCTSGNSSVESSEGGDVSKETTERSSVDNVEDESYAEDSTESESNGKEQSSSEESDSATEESETAVVTESPYIKTIELAEKLSGTVNAFFSDERKKATISNRDMILEYPLQATDAENGAITSPSGGVYVDSVSDAFIKSRSGKMFLSSDVNAKERMNIYRLGSYYYEIHMLDGKFASYDVVKESSIDLKNYNKGNGIGDISASSERVSYTIVDKSDPYIHGGSLDYNTEEYDAIAITFSTKVSTSARFYIIAGPYGGYNGAQSVAFNTIADGNQHTYIVPISSLPDYTGTLRGIRFDIGAAVGEEICITSLKMVKVAETAPDLALDMTYHLYSDKVNEVVRLVANSSVDSLASVGAITRLSANTVGSIVIKDKSGLHDSIEDVDWSSAEYVGFDIIGVGIFGYILLPDESSGQLTVTLEDGEYKIVQEYVLPEDYSMEKYDSVATGRRIYTDESHDMAGFLAVAEDERNPVVGVKMLDEGYGAKYKGYDPMRGAYIFNVNGTDFQQAYDSPYMRFLVSAAFSGVESDREIYIVTHENSGHLECGALMSSDGLMLPVDLEVCKNFRGENEEPLYDHGDTSYGEIIFPFVVEADKENRFTVINLYQNWGNYPLKQISSIQFIAPYYHLSVGTTETNCIAPYFVYGKDHWTLPDFRAISAPLWTNQPQHTSIGRLYFLEYTTAQGLSYASESIDNKIDSYGPIYSDIDMNYLSDDGKIKAYYRHMEMPHTDENRTYYEIVLEVLEDIEFNDFKNDFAFFSFDGRYYYFDKMGYLNENNECVVVDASTVGEARYITLGDRSPYVSFFDGPETENSIEYVNFGLVVKDYSFTVGGESYGGNLVLRELKQGDLNRMSLTLDLGNMTLKAGDRLSINLILLPWGDPFAENDDNVRNVREDSCLDPYVIEAVKGSVIPDNYMPKIMSENSVAEFVLSGGTNNCVVRAYGFDKLTVPTVLEWVDGEWVEYKLSSDKCSFDGYTVYYDGGTYSYAFVVDMTDVESRRFKVTVDKDFVPLKSEWYKEYDTSIDLSVLPLNVYITPENDELISGKFSVYGMTYEKSEDLSYYRFFGNGSSVEGYVSPVKSLGRFGTTGQYVVLKYRAPESAKGILGYFDVFSGTEASGPVGNGSDSYRLSAVQADGEWHVIVIDMSALSGFNEKNDGYLANYIRFDVMNGASAIPTDCYIDVAYFGMSDSLEEICALNSDMDEIMLYSDGKYSVVEIE